MIADIVGDSTQHGARYILTKILSMEMIIGFLLQPIGGRRVNG